ncbi:MAG TPA: hypothetical protein VE078_08450 [Thermoanaerobaculia bacterium]|nr:hypothetical protein [Thermoanaerobaculia bacterium]
MKTNALAVLAAAALLAGAGCASQQKTTVETDGSATTMKQTGPGENVETTTVTGVVTKYEAGNELKIRAADGNMHDFDLEDSVRMEGTIEIGKPVTVSYTERAGKKYVTVIAATGS